MTTITRYILTTERIGRLHEEDVQVVHMPRARFLEIVDATLLDLRDREDIEQVRREIWPVAETIQVFPLGAWMTSRGCGCLVGEYIISQGILDREEAAAAGNMSIYQQFSPETVSLRRFGEEVDAALRKEVGVRSVYPFKITDAKAIVIDR